ncbi:hypothetical protein AKJ66_00125 [candidate division MSBL1 archaeon SCGC-AAA259E22]|uniref:Uncharacterized protein n=1 Tax=candidate division MSBL1 archaeon SCGC-AAA259E22 TaxID=1698265 RepID=A0A133UIV1_9EURY|nr:hypothetical protein AKJ66_00125 [candidate division MSBL1 archaeon SCGC-AAA259E22]
MVYLLEGSSTQKRKRAAVRTLKALRRTGSRFRFVESGGGVFLWVMKVVEGEEIRVSIPATGRVKDLVRRAGIPESRRS